jgi:His/Glu/Gln/Arg/opine family amino acid ABC transporter permease subunit
MYWSEGGLERGLGVTLRTFAVASACTLLWGLVVALLRMSPIKVVRWMATVYIEMFRGTPLLVQLLTFFAAVPILTGLQFAPFQSRELPFGVSGRAARTTRGRRRSGAA